MALVTGAASGMGLATAKAFAEAGAVVVLADFREEAVKAEAQRLIAAGHKAIAIGCDVSDEAQVAAMVDRTVAEFGRLDAAFNNAGVMARIVPTADSTYEEWERVIGINLRAFELHEVRTAANATLIPQKCNRPVISTFSEGANLQCYRAQGQYSPFADCILGDFCCSLQGCPLSWTLSTRLFFPKP